MQLTPLGRIVKVNIASSPITISLSEVFRMPVPDIPVESNLQERDGEHFLRLCIWTIHLATEADGDLIN